MKKNSIIAIGCFIAALTAVNAISKSFTKTAAFAGASKRGVSGGGGGGGGGNTINAASASLTDVSNAIASAIAGDTVVVPAGTASWSGGLTISGITLKGPGKDAGSPTTITAGLVTITKHTNAYTKLIGFKFTGADQHFSIGGYSSNKAFVVESNHFNCAGTPFGAAAVNGGLFRKNDWYGTNLADGFSINIGQERWNTGPLMGTNDTTGEGNIYFEDNTFSQITEAIFDTDNGARVVLRYNTITDSSFVQHGGGNPDQDTSDYGGHHVEVYNNTFVRSIGGVAVNKWMWFRGGSGVICSNVIPSNTSGDYPNKTEIQLTVGCPTNYPMTCQIGQTVIPADNTPNYPMLIFNNTGSGTNDANYIALGENPNDTCATPATYIVAGRDYMTSNSWNWAPYTYPHPLASQ